MSLNKIEFPKFGSFKRTEEEKPKVERSHERQTDNKNSKGRHRESSKRKSDNADKFIQGIVTSVTSKEELFLFDLVGDKRNAEFERPHVYDLPNYRRYTSTVLGLSPYLRISQNKNDRMNCRLSIEPVGGDFDIHIDTWRRRGAISRKFSKLRKLDIEPSWNEPYIPLMDEAAYYKEAGVFDFRSADTQLQPDYRQFAETSIVDELLQNQITLQKDVDDHPSDLENWIKLIENQKLIYSKQSSASANSAVTYEVILSMYSKALTHIPGNEKLAIPYLRMYSLVNRSRSINKWKEFALNFPRQVQFWYGWLESCFSEYMNMEFLDIMTKIKSEERMVHTLQVRVSTAVSDQDREALEKALVLVIFRLCNIYRDAGYAELAVGIIQALVELNFLSGEKCTMSIEEYWSLETRRVGEADPVHYCDASFTSPVARQSGEALEEEDIFPARSTESEVDKDPYRVVLLEDISDLVYKLKCKTSALEVLYSTISFFGEQCPRQSDEDITLNLIPAKKSTFLVRLIQQLHRNHVLPSELFVWSLRYMHRYDKKGFNKLSSSLLSQNPQDLSLWTVFVELKMETASKQSSAIRDQFFDSAPKFFAQNSASDCVKFWNNYVISSLLDGSFDPDLASKFLTRISELHEIGNVTGEEVTLYEFLLRYISTIELDATDRILRIEAATAEFWASNRIYFEAMDKISQILEGHYIHSHCERGLVKIGILRDFLLKSIHLIEDFNYYEPKIGLLKKLARFQRRYNWYPIKPTVDFGNWDSTGHRIALMLYELELRQGMSELVRHAYQAAVNVGSSGLVLKDANLMQAFLNFELQESETHSQYSNSVNTFMSAIRRCPWNKQLVLCGLQQLIHVLGEWEFGETVKLLFERGFRIDETIVTDIIQQRDTMNKEEDV